MNILKVLFVAAGCFAVSSNALAEEVRHEDGKGIFNIIVENDLFTQSDRDYTNGIRLSWLSSEENMPHFVNRIADFLPLDNGGNKRISAAVGQNMYTPTDITKNYPLPDDRPYAGWLYGSVGMVSDTGKTLDNVVVTVGMVGPDAYAEQSQTFVHDIIGSPEPKGWDNQLNNEAGVILTYERKWRGIYEVEPFGMGMDVTPHVGVNLGNVITDASLGATLRLGYDLPADYGPPRIRPSLPGSDFFIPTKRLGGYLFTTIGQTVVGRNIFLDGNTFSESPSVDKRIFVSSIQAGAAITFGQMRVSYSQVYITKEYDTQKYSPKFGTITVSYRF